MPHIPSIVSGKQVLRDFGQYPYEDIVNMINNRPSHCPEYRYNFSTSATNVMDAIVDLHNDIMFFLVVIIVIVTWMLFAAVIEFREHKFEEPYYGFNDESSNV
ncbi:cytochrome c oxidase subunit II transmembrane domain-containing protein, partial [Arachidicoccus sp.]|uniref:cytochrome c oxidase subunit II transmembrane domain-containing protein n=1 Tax=Arachidicoccus sp. TaxID=1872624 RepID=UPI003D1D6689